MWLELLQPAIVRRTTTAVSAVPKMSRRFRGTTVNRSIPTTAAQRAARSQNLPSGPGRRVGATGGAILDKVVASKLAGAVTVNVIGPPIVPVRLPAFWGRKLGLPAWEPDCGIQRMPVFAEKFPPETVMVTGLAVELTLMGEMLERVGAGPSMLKFRASEGVPAFTTVTGATAAVAIADAGTTAVP